MVISTDSAKWQNLYLHNTGTLIFKPDWATFDEEFNVHVQSCIGNTLTGICSLTVEPECTRTVSYLGQLIYHL